jgi:hypothetical protein
MEISILSAYGKGTAFFYVPYITGSILAVFGSRLPQFPSFVEYICSHVHSQDLRTTVVVILLQILSSSSALYCLFIPWFSNTALQFLDRSVCLIVYIVTILLILL